MQKLSHIMRIHPKWLEAYAIPDQEVETAVDALIEGMFSRFGTAETIYSDQVRNFESHVFATMCDRLGMRKTRTTPLHPQSDSLTVSLIHTPHSPLSPVHRSDVLPGVHTHTEQPGFLLGLQP